MELYEIETNSVVAVLSIYRRTQYFEEQLNSILGQTIVPKEIFIWVNYHEDNLEFVDNDLYPLLNKYDYKGFRVIKNDFNWKFHGRFSIAQMAQSEYVCVLDDDTIPGNGWFENCIKSMRIKNGLMGCIGEIYYLTPENHVHMHKTEGWRSNNQTIKRVDVVGHSWFFRKEWLKFLWMEEPVTWDVCEDIQFSYCLQKYGGIYSYVPPQPIEDIDLCGSSKGYEYGGDEVASYILFMDEWRGLDSLRFKVYNEYIFQRGMELIHRKKRTTNEVITWNHERIGNN
jgi:GT2 family glycosyltransferase